MNSFKCSDFINVCFRKCILPSLEFFGGSWLPQISCYFSPWVLVPWRISHLGWGSEARSVLVSLQREENSVSQALSVGIFWPVSFLSLLRTKQNWEKALPLDCNQPSLGFERENTEKWKPEAKWPGCTCIPHFSNKTGLSVHPWHHPLEYLPSWFDLL